MRDSKGRVKKNNKFYGIYGVQPFHQNYYFCNDKKELLKMIKKGGPSWGYLEDIEGS